MNSIDKEIKENPEEFKRKYVKNIEMFKVMDDFDDYFIQNMIDRTQKEETVKIWNYNHLQLFEGKRDVVYIDIYGLDTEAVCLHVEKDRWMKLIERLLKFNIATISCTEENKEGKQGIVYSIFKYRADHPEIIKYVEFKKEQEKK